MTVLRKEMVIRLTVEDLKLDALTGGDPTIYDMTSIDASWIETSPEAVCLRLSCDYKGDAEDNPDD